MIDICFNEHFILYGIPSCRNTFYLGKGGLGVKFKTSNIFFGGVKLLIVDDMGERGSQMVKKVLMYFMDDPLAETRCGHLLGKLGFFKSKI